MPETKQSSATNNLLSFINFLYGDKTGYVYIALKGQTGFHQLFFEYPQEKDALAQTIVSKRGQADVYIAPALFKVPDAKKVNVKGSNVIWCEFDGTIPDHIKQVSEKTGIPEPSLRIQSSEKGHEHWYWLLDKFLEVEEIEQANRSLAYALHADTSGWDANQILRPPDTLNHKRNKPTTVVGYSGSHAASSAAFFRSLPAPPEMEPEPAPTEIPAIEHVISQYPFQPKAYKLFKYGVPVGKRSSGLMALGYYCAEMQMSTQDALAVLINADERWGKFNDRDDRVQRLMEIITRSRVKFPLQAELEVDNKFQDLGFVSIWKSEVEIEWIWDGLLHKGGLMTLTGPPGVGKTQLILNLLECFALGKPFLQREVHTMKCGLFSLEMGLVDLKVFVSKHAVTFDPEELKQLEDNFRIYPLGEPVYLTHQIERKKIEQLIADTGLNVIAFDSLGSTTEGELSNEKDIRSIFDWIDRLRNKYGVAVIFVHHHRKATSDNKKPNKLSDVFGSMYITARPTSVLALWPSNIKTAKNKLELIPLKVRLTENPGNLLLTRSTNLQFSYDPSVLKVVETSAAPSEEERKEAPPKGGRFEL